MGEVHKTFAKHVKRYKGLLRDVFDHFSGRQKEENWTDIWYLSKQMCFSWINFLLKTNLKANLKGDVTNKSVEGQSIEWLPFESRHPNIWSQYSVNNLEVELSYTIFPPKLDILTNRFYLNLGSCLHNLKINLLFSSKSFILDREEYKNNRLFLLVLQSWKLM